MANKIILTSTGSFLVHLYWTQNNYATLESIFILQLIQEILTILIITWGLCSKYVNLLTYLKIYTIFICSDQTK